MFTDASKTFKLANDTIELLKSSDEVPNLAALYTEFSLLFFIRSEYDKVMHIFSNCECQSFLKLILIMKNEFNNNHVFKIFLMLLSVQCRYVYSMISTKITTLLIFNVSNTIFWFNKNIKYMTIITMCER